MKIQKDIAFFDEKQQISVVYTNSNFKAGDTEVAIYSKYKISILMTDGINAVKSNSIIGGNKCDILFFRPDELHFGRFLKSGDYTYLDIFIPLTFFERFTNDTSVINFLTDNSTNRRNCIHFNAEKQNVINKIVSEIIENIKNDDKSNDMKLFSFILRIILLCNDFYDAETLKPVNYKMPDMILNTMRFISENYNQKLSMKEIACRSHCSVTYLSRIFKQYVGMTVYDYITTTRIAKAQIMLREGKSVTEACFLSGFNDCSNFINKFKRVTNETPSEFKKHLR
ncbi:MAG: AraC family transcriptional regulator [Clostridiales bacterium]|nr:AraC family transcriptional regulator [Clostridiales bacterium]